MINQKIIFPAFLIMVLLQLFVPAKMIYDQESILVSGKPFKFKTAPVDPTDLFRGKYVALEFEANSFEVGLDEDWKAGDEVFVSVSEGSDGYAQISEVSESAPIEDEHYFKASIARYDRSGSISSAATITLDFPFNRFYMEESKALEAENLYRTALQEEGAEAYALVYLKNGNAALKNVMLNGRSLKEQVEALRLED